MRVTIFHSHFGGMAGAEILLLAQSRWLLAAGHEVRIAVFHSSSADCSEAFSGIPIDEIGMPPGFRRMERVPLALMPRLVAAAAPVLARSDIVMAYNYPAAPVTAAALSAPHRRLWYACEPYRALHLRDGNPVAVSRLDQRSGQVEDEASRQVRRRLLRRRWLHALVPGTARHERELQSWDASGVRALDAVTALSAYSAMCVAKATGRTDCSVIHPMVNFTPESAVPRRRGLRREAPEILLHSRLSSPKNIDTVLRAFALVRRAHRAAVLHIVGSGERHRMLASLASRLDLGDAVRFHGFLSRDDIDTISARCDVFVFAPVDEPFGMVFPEAAARGLLLVGSDHGGPREILEDGGIGELCDAFRAESVAEAIHRTFALSDADADTRRARADVSVRTRFGHETVGRLLEAFLRG